MNQETFEKAKDLVRKIKELESALGLFGVDPEGVHALMSTNTNARIIIEYDHFDGPEQEKLPLRISDVLIVRIKMEIEIALQQAKEEFAAL